MNENTTVAVKKALAFGFAGALGIPLCYEIFCNLSGIISYALLVLAAVFAGVKFSRIKLKDALFGFVLMFVLMTGFGIIAFMIIHPAAVKFLEERSRYFYASAADSARFFVKAAAIQLVVPAVCIAKSSLEIFLKKLKENSDATKNYIDNAFDDDMKG